LKQKSSSSRNLWLTRLYYVLYFGAMGAINPFINLFYVHNHLSGTEIGVLGTINALVGLISAPIWGRWNDNLRRPRLILQITLGANALAFFLLSQQTAFLDTAIIIGFNALLTSCVNPQSQTQALAAAGEVGAGYGSVRLFGSLGYAVVAALSGLLIQRTSLLSAFYVFGGLTLLAILVLSLIHTQINLPNPTVEPAKKPAIPMREVLREMVKNRELVAFSLALVVMWAAANGTGFESVYLQQLGAKSSSIGWINMIGAGCEIPMMILADRVWRRKGSTTTLLLGFLAYSLATLFIVVHPAVASFIIYRIINGASLALYSVSFTYFIVERSPAQQTGTMLALYSVTIAGMVSILMSPISGRIFDLVGPYWLYVMAFAGYLTAAAIIYFMVARKPRSSKPQLSSL
jgi:PPP family 3-phenylpropionic acid transporter